MFVFPKHVSFGCVFEDASNWIIGLHIVRRGLIPSSLRVNHFLLLWELSAKIAHSTPIDGEIASHNCHLPPWPSPLHFSIQLSISAAPYQPAIIIDCRHYWVSGPPSCTVSDKSSHFARIWLSIWNILCRSTMLSGRLVFPLCLLS